MKLLDRIQSREAVVAVIGLGYVGLPLAVAFAKAGFQVVGIDHDGRKVETLNAGMSYISDVATADVAALVSRQRLSATIDFCVLAQVDAVSICVPTPLSKTKDPDMSYILAATEQVARYAHPGMLVVLESTTYPGTTDEVIVPSIEATGLTVGEDVFVAFSPERVDPGNLRFQIHNTPKIIGGHTPVCREVAHALYATAFEAIVPVSSTRTAEMAKLLENTFRAVNIGLVNEVALMCEKLGVDVWEVIDTAATKPFGFMRFTPGPGLGGHCIPVDPHYLAWKMKSLNFQARFIELADEINGLMPDVVLTRVMRALNQDGKPVKGARILVLGVAYKADIDDTRESPALDVIQQLREHDAEVFYHDPYVPYLQVNGDCWRSAPFGEGLENEQMRRAQRLEKLGALRVLDPQSLDAPTLAVEIQRLLNFEPCPVKLDMNGARNTARLVADMAVNRVAEAGR